MCFYADGYRFLDESHADETTRELIRWSDDGNSFIVLDEDKFAQNLVPELFKHSNYASFVRQLNMYGFHKKVGLSDNSMRASEKKSKSPSEYQNPYFKRGRSELLWLIQKPKSEALNKKRKKGKPDDQDSGDEQRLGSDMTTNGPTTSGYHTDVVTSSHYNSLQREVHALQNSQRQITQMLARLRDENNQYIRQASTLVAQHERHENSINAILTFLATFYNRNMENGNLAGMFPGAMPSQQPQGNVVDVGDFDDSFQAQLQRPLRRPLALLPAPGPASATSSQRPTPIPLSSNSPVSPQLRQRPDRRGSPRGGVPKPTFLQARVSSYHSSPRTSASPPIKDSPKTPDLMRQYSPERDSPGHVQNHDDMMNVIHNANSAQANADGSFGGPQFDINAALQQFHNANGNSGLTPQEQDNVINLMNTQSGATTPLPTSKANEFNNTTQDQQYSLNSYLDQFNNNRQHIDMLQRLQEQQNSKVQDLAARVQPLSPSGSIPGLAISSSNGNAQRAHAQGTPSLHSNPSFGTVGDFDINAFLNSDYFSNPNLTFDANALPDFNGDFDFGASGVDGLNVDGITPVDGIMPDDSSLFGRENGGSDTDVDATSLLTTNEEYGNADAGNAVAARRVGSITTGGEIIGSVGSSSGAPSPMVEEVEDEEESYARKKRKRA